MSYCWAKVSLKILHPLVLLKAIEIIPSTPSRLLPSASSVRGLHEWRFSPTSPGCIRLMCPAQSHLGFSPPHQWQIDLKKRTWHHPNGKYDINYILWKTIYKFYYVRTLYFFLFIASVFQISYFPNFVTLLLRMWYDLREHEKWKHKAARNVEHVILIDSLEALNMRSYNHYMYSITQLFWISYGKLYFTSINVLG